MSRYRSYGKLDDQFTSEGDTFFLRMNARLRPNQLKPGEVALSKNGRMNKDGTWQTRKGLSTLFGSITSGADAIRIPYTILSAQRQGGVVTLTLDIAPSLSFIPGENITIDDLDASVDGIRVLSTVSFITKTVTFANAGSNVVFGVKGNNVGNTSVVQAGNSIPTTLNFILNDNGVNAVFGSSVFSDATSNSDDYIFTATDTTCIVLRLNDQALFKCRYEAGGESVDGPVGMVQGLGKMYIFRTRQTTLESTPSVQQIAVSAASQSGQTITVDTSAAHGRLVNDYVTLTGFGNWTNDPNDCYQVVSQPTSYRLTVTMATSQTKTFNVSGASVEYFLDFARVKNGTFTSPLYMTDTNCVSANGLVTFDVPGANQNPANSSYHNISVGDDITIRAGAAPYDSVLGQTARAISASATVITFNLGVTDTTIASLTISKPLSVGKGFIHQPAAPWGVVHERRLWLPYWYTSATTPADRGNRSEIVASDIMDFDTLDVIGNQFNPSAGQSDYLVQLTPFTKDSLVVFNRKSIHLMTGVSGTLSDVKTNVVTTEIGCSARKSVVQVANKIMFLSDQGIYSVEFIDEYNLRGTGMPISETIQPFIDRINQDYVHLSCAVYFDNKFWIALPLNSEAGAATTKLNTIIVYSFLNGGFESIDTVNSENFAIRELIVGKEGSQNALYLTTEEGGVHKVDGADGGDVVSMIAGQAIPETIAVISQCTTRQYDADVTDRKMFARSEFHIKSSDDGLSDGDISFITEDPDSTTSATSISTLLGSTLPLGEDSSIRLGVRKRGFGIQADFKPTTGRPFLRAVKIDARITDRSTTSIS